MRYGSLVVSAAVLLGLAACKGNDSGMNADLAKDLNAAKSADALALAPHAGVQTVVSAEELTPQGRAQLRASRRSTHLVVRHRAPASAPVQDIATAATEAAPTSVAPLPAATTSTEVVAATPATTVVQTPAIMNAQPKPAGPETIERDHGGGGGGGIGSILGAIGGAILRGGVVDGDHCDPRGRGGIMINRRGPILRGTY